MMQLKSLSIIPAGGMRFRHPISGAEQSFHSWNLLRDWVTAHCLSNGYQPISDEEIQHQLCERLGPKIAGQYCEGEGVSVDGVSLTWNAIWSGTKTMASFLLAGRPLVDRDEAERRAAICSTCPRNVFFTKPCGGACIELTAVVDAIVGPQVTSNDHMLEACSACSCALRSKVWIPLEIIKKSEDESTNAKYVENCWCKT